MLFTMSALAMVAVGQDSADWYEPFPAHKVVRNVYCGGFKDLASFLITTPEGHILINFGFERTVPLTQKSVESLGFKPVNNKAYPEIAADFAKTLKVLKSLPREVFLGAHGAYYGMVARYALLQKGQANAFVNPSGYKEYVGPKERAFHKTLAAPQGKPD
jgi:hypothetical protein